MPTFTEDTVTVLGVECVRVGYPDNTDNIEVLWDLAEALHGKRVVCGMCPEKDALCSRRCGTGYVFVEAKYLPILQMRGIKPCE